MYGVEYLNFNEICRTKPYNRLAQFVYWYDILKSSRYGTVCVELLKLPVKSLGNFVNNLVYLTKSKEFYKNR